MYFAAHSLEDVRGTNSLHNSHVAKGLGASNVQARERWSRAVASVPLDLVTTDSEGVDRTMSRVRNISKKVRFYEDSGFSVLKMGNMPPGFKVFGGGSEGVGGEIEL
ncbi:hypothetical protein AK812_SmicGene11311 [Symbiodinium microadriaticum]|uniref:Uncharacterized protein n=1 Tax=Symbiodinium microadriaticum TaxID=2951 RepID=A0A1Q9EDJ4_SYMMI|nr:hypothetical protein AK812_SmicGene11311 [Symbiodinium microadriaticum]CAE7266537.1 unnamed protein product [Symbiodinium microadriaticum]